MALIQDLDHLRRIFGDEVVAWTETPSVHVVENMTTESLDHVAVTCADGSVHQVFAKTLHPASASPMFQFIPLEHHEHVLENLHWLDEPRVYECGLHQDMPAGIRLPVLHGIDRASDDHLVLWLEYVEDHGGRWTMDRYRRAARCLGRLTGRWPESRVMRDLGLGRRSLYYLFYGKVLNADLPLLADDATWDDPAVRAATVVDPNLREDLMWLAGAAPELLDRAEALPHGLAHGDAAPANFHEPGDGTVVAFDWSYGSSGPIGSDLAQLLAGGFESGDADAADIHDIAETIFVAFTEGLVEENHSAPAHEIRLAWATHLAVRSAFSAILMDEPEMDEQNRVDRIGRRAALARFAIDLARSVT